MEILHAGLPSFCRQGLASVATVILNLRRTVWRFSYCGMSIVSRFMMFINSALIGSARAFSRYAVFNFGAKRYDRVLEAFWFCVKVAITMLTCFGIIAFAVSRPIITAFRREDIEVIRIGTLALRLQILTLPLQAWVIMVNMLTQSIGYGVPRFALVAMGRQGLFLIPFLLILPRICGILGFSWPSRWPDVFTFALATFIVVRVLEELESHAGGQK